MVRWKKFNYRPGHPLNDTDLIESPIDFVNEESFEHENYLEEKCENFEIKEFFELVLLEQISLKEIFLVYE